MVKDDVYKVRRILAQRPLESKGKTTYEYLVDWEPSWTADLSGDDKEQWNYKIIVCGPSDNKSNKDKNDLKDMDWVIWKVNRTNNKDSQAYEISYSDLKKGYTPELMEYYEKHFH